jgi:hypothetical protein
MDNLEETTTESQMNTDNKLHVEWKPNRRKILYERINENDRYYDEKFMEEYIPSKEEFQI